MGAVERLAPSPSGQFVSERLERVFSLCFTQSLGTRLQGGADEPLYQPASADDGMHVLYYREDFFASALHEIAHWCIAGPSRRELVDFGYWYAPDGRTAAQQQAFEAVEYKPQALEWFFCKACGYRFRLSVDNLETLAGELPDTSGFRAQVVAQARRWQVDGLPQRAERFFQALCREFDTKLAPGELLFTAEQLG